ncbi:calmodulin-like [Ptychodera flava]|uniref:calmodulin-like n=1 Tax=Ptychodera flava TaxID=63121 RepID=UPI003969E7E4
MMEAANSFTDEQIHSFRDAFLGYDRHGDGRVRVKELGKVLKACGENPSMEELHKIWNEASADGKKTVDFADFLKIMSDRVTIDPEGDIRAAFRAFDVKDTGFIDGVELQHVLESLHDVAIPPEEIAELIEDIDLNKDGRINYGEFLNHMKRTEAFEDDGV